MSRQYPADPIEPGGTPPAEFTDHTDREIRIRAYDGGIDSLVEMYVDFDPADRAQGIPPTTEVEIRRWLTRILQPESVNTIALHEDRVVGHATLVPDDEGAYELAIFVHHHYQEAGIGTQLIGALLAQGREAGVELVWLTVEPWNEPAIKLYRKIGFETTSQDGFELEMAARI